MSGLSRHHRAYLAFAAGTLAVAVGANLIVFTAVNALWIRPLPFPNADRVVTIVGGGLGYTRFEGPVFKSFEAVAGQVVTDDLLSGMRPQIEFAQVGRDLETLAVTPGYFRLLGLAIRGRDFTAEENRVGAEAVAIISYRLWSREFGRRADLIGRVIPARPVSVRVIGVAPPGFEGARRGERADLWIPSSLVRRVVPMQVEWSSVPMMVFARLFPGQTAPQVDRRLKETFANDRSVSDLSVVPLKDVFGAPESRTIIIRERNALSVVAGLAMLVLVGGCAALAALVLVHYERRRLELAVKVALGASRWQVIRGLLRELAWVAALGSIGAVIVAVLGLRAIPPLSLPGGVDLGRLDLSIDWRVLAVAIAITALTLLASASLPITRFTRAGLAGELWAGPAATASVASQRLRQALLGLLVCATIIVLVSAGLFVRAVLHGFGNAPGFDVSRTVFASVQVVSPLLNPGPTWRETIAERTSRVREALRSLPGVEAVADGRPPIDPEATARLRRPITVEFGGQRRELLLGRLDGSPDLLPTLGVRMLAGRGLAVTDGTMNPVPAVVTSSLAKRLWPGESPLGRVISTSWRGGPLEIVGVAPDFVFGSLARPATGVVVTATSDFSLGLEPRFVVRTVHPEALVDPIRKVVGETLPDAPGAKVTTGRDIVARDLGRQRLGAWFFSGFGLTALILGVGGVFGLVAYLAESRQREFGVRLALGATTRDLVRHALVAALVPVSLGIAAGLLCAAWIAQLFTSLLTGLSAIDPLTYVGVAVTMLGCATSAALAGAWRLRRMMPTDALRTN